MNGIDLCVWLSNLMLLLLLIMKNKKGRTH
jgi:hypothetical protein